MCGRGEEGACLGSGHLRCYRESDTEVAAVAEHPGHSVTAAQEQEGLLLVPGALVLEEEVWQPVGWVTEGEEARAHVSVCVHPLKASC